MAVDSQGDFLSVTLKDCSKKKQSLCLQCGMTNQPIRKTDDCVCSLCLVSTFLLLKLSNLNLLYTTSQKFGHTFLMLFFFLHKFLYWFDYICVAVKFWTIFFLISKQKNQFNSLKVIILQCHLMIVDFILNDQIITVLKLLSFTKCERKQLEKTTKAASSGTLSKHC